MVKVNERPLPGEVATLPPILCASLDHFCFFDSPSYVLVCATTSQRIDYRVLLLRKSEGPLLKYCFSEGLSSLLQVLRTVLALREGKVPKKLTDGLCEMEGITMRQFYSEEEGRQDAQVFRSGRRASLFGGGPIKEGPFSDSSKRNLAYCSEAIDASSVKFPHGKARAILGFVRFLRGYYMVLARQRKRVANIGPHIVYEVQDTIMVPIFNADMPQPVGNSSSGSPAESKASAVGNALSSLLGLGVKGEEDKYVNMFRAFDLKRFSYYSHTYDLTNTLQVNMLRRHRALAARKALVRAEEARAEELEKAAAAVCEAPLTTCVDTSTAPVQQAHFLGDPEAASQLPSRSTTTTITEPSSTPPPPINADPREKFVWNDFLLQPTRVGEPRDLNSEHPVDAMEVHDSQDRWVETMWKSWTVPIIHGCVVEAQFDCNVAGKGPVKFVLIGRSSKKFAGARYLKRGLNSEGCVANHVEVEQIVYDSASMTRFDTRGAFSSFVQVRGSVPVSWYHPPVNRPKPPIVIGHNGDQYNATRLHFEELLEDLGAPIVAVNLLKTSEKKGRELGLSLEYRRALATLSWPLRNGRWLKDLHGRYGEVGYEEEGVPSESPNTSDGLANMAVVNEEVHRLHVRASERQPITAPSPASLATSSDGKAEPSLLSASTGSSSHHQSVLASTGKSNKPQCKTFMADESVLPSSLIQYVEFDLRNNSDSAWNSLTALAEARIPPVGVFSCNNVGEVFSKQCGALRSNCVDCIDRTNLGQFFFGLYALSIQLQSIGMLVDSCDVVLSNEVPETVLRVFLCLGDAIAIQYGGSAQVGAGLLHRGLGWDKIMGIRRLYTNMLVDKDKQAVTNLFLGLYSPSPTSQRLRQVCFVHSFKARRRFLHFICHRRKPATTPDGTVDDDGDLLEEVLEKESAALRFVSLPLQRKVQRNFWGQVQSEVEDADRYIDLYDLETDYYLHTLLANAIPSTAALDTADWWRAPLMAYHTRHDPYFYFTDATLAKRISYHPGTGTSNTDRPVLSQNETKTRKRRGSDMFDAFGGGGGGGGGMGYRSSWLLVETGGVMEVEDDLLDDVVEKRWTRAKNKLTVAARRHRERNATASGDDLVDSPTRAEQALDGDSDDGSDTEAGIPQYNGGAKSAPPGKPPVKVPPKASPSPPPQRAPPQPAAPQVVQRADGNASLFFARLITTTATETTVRPSRRLPLVDRVPIDRHATSGAALVVEPSFIVQKPWVHDVASYPGEVEKSRYRWEERRYRWMLFEEAHQTNHYPPLITPTTRARFSTATQAEVVMLSTPTRYSQLDSRVTIEQARPGDIVFSQALSQLSAEVTDDQAKLFVAVIAQFGSPYTWDRDTTMRVLTRLDSELPNRFLEAVAVSHATGEYFLQVGRSVILEQLGGQFATLIDNIRRILRRAHQSLTNRNTFDTYLKSGTTTVEELERLIAKDALCEASFEAKAAVGPNSLLQNGRPPSASTGGGTPLYQEGAAQDGGFSSYYEYTTTFRGGVGVPFSMTGRPFEDDVRSVPPYWEYPALLEHHGEMSSATPRACGGSSAPSITTSSFSGQRGPLNASFDPELARLALEQESASRQMGRMSPPREAVADDSGEGLLNPSRYVTQLLNVTADRPSTVSNVTATCNAFQRFFVAKLTEGTVEEVLVDFVEEISHIHTGVPLGSCIRYVERQGGGELFRSQEYPSSASGHSQGGNSKSHPHSSSSSHPNSPNYNPESQPGAAISTSLPVPIVVPHVFTVPVWCSWLSINSERIGLTFHRVPPSNARARVEWCRVLTELLVNAGVILKCEIPTIWATGLGVTINSCTDFEDDMMLYTFAACLSKRPLNLSRAADAARAAVRTKIALDLSGRRARNETTPTARSSVIGIGSIVELSEAMVSIALGVFTQFDVEIRRIAQSIQARSGGVVGTGGGAQGGSGGSSTSSGISGPSIARQALAQVMSRNTFDVAEELRRVDISCLGLEERVCFFVNVFNALFIQSWIASTVQPQLDIISYYLTAGYTIGGHFLSLADIKYGILRGNRPANFLMLPQFLMDDARKVLTVKYDKEMSPRISYALLDTYVSHDRLFEVRPYDAGAAGLPTPPQQQQTSALQILHEKGASTLGDDTAPLANDSSGGYEAAIAAARKMMEAADRRINVESATSGRQVVSAPSGGLVPGPEASPAAFKPKDLPVPSNVSSSATPPPTTVGDDDDDEDSSETDDEVDGATPTNGADVASRRTILFHHRPGDLPEINSPTARFVVDGPGAKQPKGGGSRKKGVHQQHTPTTGWGILDVIPRHSGGQQPPQGGTAHSPHSRTQNFIQQSNSAYRAVAQWFSGSRKAAVVTHFCRPMRPDSLFDDLIVIEQEFSTFLMETYAAYRPFLGAAGLTAMNESGNVLDPGQVLVGAGVVADGKGALYPRELVPLAALEEIGSLEAALNRAEACSGQRRP